MQTRVERYLAHLDRLSGGREPKFTPFRSTRPGMRDVTAIVYRDLPEPGFVTGLTYGLSLSGHPAWTRSTPELCISVRSADDAWAWAVAYLAERLRGGDCHFAYGDTFGFGERVSGESDMDAFVLSAPIGLDREDFLGIDVGDDLPVSITGCYPIHSSERRFIQENGLKAFWDLDWDPCDVTRAAVA
ncbi:suppressor of fused domain protein [Planomonospora sp. ID91781]|uniref:suppressor of fused domain protein n=1 Tax=Planomonospora sp. ID91781 TaxID=2738135 RepID=UPI0018C41BF4|nr:suppressor of fused domain protein [Planomonospora sp. ID91781]MBG0820056.1 suppressor of fused domain protein [Planomonospora sp. ID91781]